MHGRGYRARDVERILGVKPHVLRYWEQSLPILRPRRDDSGRRIWTAAQLRMLLRVRHLVVGRGMSVAAAGDALLYEAEPGRAEAKSRMEALRARLLSLLLRNRAQGQRLDGGAENRATEDGVPGGDEGDRGEMERWNAAPGPQAEPELNAVPRDNAVPERKAAARLDAASGRKAAAKFDAASGLTAAPRVAYQILPPPGFLEDGIALSSIVALPSRRSKHGIAAPANAPCMRAAAPIALERALSRTVAHVPMSHLFAVDSTARIASTVVGILAQRRNAADPIATILPVPAWAVDDYRAAYVAVAEDSPIFVLPIRPVTHRGLTWWSPRLAVLVALAGDVGLSRWLEDRGIDLVYLWAFDDPTVPERPPAEAVRVAGSQQSEDSGSPGNGIVCAVRTVRRTTRAVDATLIALDALRPSIADVIGHGRWRVGPVVRDGGSVAGLERTPATGDDRVLGWRFDLEPRGLLSAARDCYRLPTGSVTGPWRGCSWVEEARRIWGIEE